MKRNMQLCRPRSIRILLYNTLDTICWQAKLSHNDEIFDTTYALAALLRGTMSNRDPFVTVEQEIEYVTLISGFRNRGIVTR